MATSTTDQPGRDKPNDSEDRPGFESEDEAQRGARRQGGLDPKRDRSPYEQDDRKVAEERGEGGRLPGRQD